MNTLSQLNNYSNTGFEFTDDRPESYTFSPDTPVNQSISVYENQVITAPSYGTSITSIINRSQDLAFNVNVASVPGTTVVWPTLATHMTQSNANGVFTLNGIRSPNDWETVKQPWITMPVNPNNWSFTSNIVYRSGNVKTWDTSVTVVQLDQFTAASDYYYIDNVSGVITGAPQIYSLGIDGFEPASYTCNVASSDNSVFGNLSCSGGTFAANVLTFTGNLATINSKLAAISYWPTSGIESTWIATYSLNNPNSGFISTRTQTIKSQTATYLDRPTSFYYDRNLPLQTVSGYPLVVDTISNVAANYSMVITSIESGVFGNLKTTYASGTSVFSANTLTITGNKATINSHLATLKYTPALDYASNMHLRFQLTVPTGNISVRVQDALISANNTIISNMSVSRTYVSNTPEQAIFANNTPQIIEVVSGNPNYTIYLTSTAGKFGVAAAGADAVASYSFTGNKASVNSLFSTIDFYPYKDVVGSQTFTYTQARSGVTQTSQIVSLVGNARSTAIPGIGTYNFTTNQVFTPTYEQANYLSANITITAGGAGGGGNLYKVYSTGYAAEAGGGGGGAGGNVTITGNSITGPTTITVGTGGTGGYGLLQSGNISAYNGNNGGLSSVVTPTWSSVCAGGTGGKGGYINSSSTIVYAGNGGDRGSPTAATGQAGSVVDYTSPANGPSTGYTRPGGGSGAVRNGTGFSYAGAILNEQAVSGTLTSPGSGGNGGYNGAGYIPSANLLPKDGSPGLNGKVTITFY